MLLPNVLSVNMCRGHRRRKISYIHWINILHTLEKHITYTGQTSAVLLSSLAYLPKQLGMVEGTLWSQLPGRPRGEDCWSPGAGGQHGQHRGTLSPKQGSKQTNPKYVLRNFSFSREEMENKVQTTQISFVKCFEIVLRNAVLITQSKKHKKIQCFLSFLSEGQRAQILGSKYSKLATTVD